LANQPISAVPKNVSSVSVLIDIYKHERFALASSLQKALQTQGSPHLDCRLRVEIVQAGADQFRWMLDAEAPWQTTRGK